MKIAARPRITARLAAETAPLRTFAAVCLLGAIHLLLGLSGVSAAQLTWDPSQNGSGIAGNGNWDTNTTGNWTGGTGVYADGGVAKFDDTASGTTAIIR